MEITMGVKSFCFVLIFFYLNKLCLSSEVTVGVVLPKTDHYPWSIPQVLPAIELALERVRLVHLPNTPIEILVADSDCSETKGPLAAFDLYQKGANVFVGPVCNYAVAPIARFSSHWNIPIITAGATADNFDNKLDFKLLTRIYKTTLSTSESVIQFINYFGWTQIELIYTGQSECFFTIKSIYMNIKRRPQDISCYHQKIDKGSDLKQVLQIASSRAKVFVLCGSPDIIRDLMIAANELQMDRGEFVFLNIDMINSEQDMEMPWYRQNDTYDRNSIARKAYEVLMTLTVRQPRTEEYSSFSNEVKRRGKSLYPNVKYKPENVNGFVGAFHDAILLYALALNKTIEAGEMITNGSAVSMRMWNTSFNSITGVVDINGNGDRLIDYSLLDMNPQTGRFEVVANFIAKSKQVEPVPGKQIYFGVDYDIHKTDTQPCGSESSNCSDKNDKEEKRPNKRQKVSEMLDDLQKSFTKISMALEEHRIKLAAVANLMKEDENS